MLASMAKPNDVVPLLPTSPMSLECPLCHAKALKDCATSSGRFSIVRDIAKQIARAVFENNREALYQAFANAALKRNAAFQQLADRAYGKLKERVEYEVSEYREVSEKAIIEGIRQLEAQLGIVRQLDGATVRRLPDVRVID